MKKWIKSCGPNLSCGVSTTSSLWLAGLAVNVQWWRVGLRGCELDLMCSHCWEINEAKCSNRGGFSAMWGFALKKTVMRCYDFTKKECKQSVKQLNCPQTLHVYFCFRPGANSGCHYRHCARVCVCVCSPADLEVCCRRRTVGLRFMVKHRWWCPLHFSLCFQTGSHPWSPGHSLLWRIVGWKPLFSKGEVAGRSSC